MESQAVTTVFLQAALAVIMLGLGLGLTVEDFRRVVRYPRAVAIASSPNLLNDTTMAMPAAIYSIIMFFTAGIFGWSVNRRRSATP